MLFAPADSLTRASVPTVVLRLQRFACWWISLAVDPTHLPPLRRPAAVLVNVIRICAADESVNRNIAPSGAAVIAVLPWATRKRLLLMLTAVSVGGVMWLDVFVVVDADPTEVVGVEPLGLDDVVVDADPTEVFRCAVGISRSSASTGNNGKANAHHERLAAASSSTPTAALAARPAEACTALAPFAATRREVVPPVTRDHDVQ